MDGRHREKYAKEEIEHGGCKLGNTKKNESKEGKERGTPLPTVHDSRLLPMTQSCPFVDEIYPMEWRMPNGQ